MRKNWIMTVALASCILLSLPYAAQATSGWRSDWAAYYGASASCSTCHTSTPALNPYGNELSNANNGNLSREEVFVAVEDIDSDGGGATNGQEIVVDGTDPADPGDDAAVPTDGTTWGAVQALFK